MAENSKIEWTTHTFNPWRGCTKVSPGCAHCYAETLSKRNPTVLGEWGDKGIRAIGSESYWEKPLHWERKARRTGVRPRVFCASLADVFEDRPELDEPRQRLFDLILATPNLDWLLLTKRPQVAADWLVNKTFGGLAHEWGAGWPNVWLGTSVEDQERAKERVPILLSIPAVVHWLSVEPLLGPLDLGRYLYLADSGYTRECREWPYGRVDWVIVGGESGPGARPMHPDWVRSIRDQCGAAGVPFFFKQWGDWIGSDHEVAVKWPIRHEIMKEAGKVHVWPYRKPTGPPHFGMNFNLRVGKKAAGRVLDGRTWDQFPTPVAGGQAEKATS